MAYTDHFGLTTPPFDANPDPRFIYPHVSYREALATLRYGIESRKGFIFISGAAGCGKTTLLHILIRLLDPTVCAALISNRPGSLLELLQTISSAFQLPPGDDAHAMMSRLNDFLIQQLRRGRVSCLLFDDAHELNDELLEQIRLLSNLETDKVKLLQIALLGEPELETRLEQPGLWQLKQRVVLRRRLETLSYAEIGLYIASRVEAAGRRQDDIFARDAIETIAAYSNGIPKLINDICANALAMAAAASKKEISLALVEEVARNLELHRAGQVITGPAQAKARAPGVEFAEHSGDRSTEAWKLELAEFRRRHQARVSAPSRRRLTSSPWMGVGMLLTVMTLAAVCLLFYSREIGNSLWKLPAKLTREGVRAANDQSVQRVANDKGRILLGEQKRSISASSVDAATQRRSADAHAGKGYDKNAEPEIAPARVSSKKTAAANAIQKRTAGVVKGELSPSPNTQDRRAENNERRQIRDRVFEVVASSFVRDRPRSDADIIATLEPGTRVRLIAQRGQYFEVSWLTHTVLRGFVHREDAFFEPVRVGSAARR